MDLTPRNILILDLGQLGDVVLSLPALEAVRDRFPAAKRNILVGAAVADVVRMTGIFDEVIVVDRGELRRMNKLRATSKLLNLALDIRRRNFDLIIDIHSLPETNILAFVAGAPLRLLGNRESRSIDRLSNFRPRPPVEDKTIHISRYYLNVLQPLGINVAQPKLNLRPRREDLEFVIERFSSAFIENGRLVGISPGAGNESRRWPIGNFAALAGALVSADLRVVVFLGPEEASNPAFTDAFGKSVSIVYGLTIPQLAAAFSRLSVLVGNDSGPVHIAAAVGVPVVILQNRFSPKRYLPLASTMRVLQEDSVAEINVSEAVTAVREILSSAGA